MNTNKLILIKQLNNNAQKLKIFQDKICKNTEEIFRHLAIQVRQNLEVNGKIKDKVLLNFKVVHKCIEIKQNLERKQRTI